MNFYKHHLGDYEAATAHLSWDEDCAYSRLMRVYYRREKALPDDVKEIYRLVRAASKSQRAAVDRVLDEFFTRGPDGWHNKRCDEEIAAYQAQADTNRRIARERIVQRTVERNEHEASTVGSPNQNPRTRSQNQMPDSADVRALVLGLGNNLTKGGSKKFA